MTGWGWARWGLYYLLLTALLFATYSEVIHTRFECVVFSLLALMFLEHSLSLWGISVTQSASRDHRGALYADLAERIGKPIDPALTEAFQNQTSETEKVLKRQRVYLAGSALPTLIVTFNLLKAVFWGWEAN